ncbi:hypothetical protein V8C35DRAFT_310574 [Trichoderma chlorosporum]
MCEWALCSFSSSKLPSRLLNSKMHAPGPSKHQQASAPSFSCQPALRAVRIEHVGDYRLCLESNIATAHVASRDGRWGGVGTGSRSSSAARKELVSISFRLWLWRWLWVRDGQTDRQADSTE